MTGASTELCWRQSGRLAASTGGAVEQARAARPLCVHGELAALSYGARAARHREAGIGLWSFELRPGDHRAQPAAHGRRVRRREGGRGLPSLQAPGRRSSTPCARSTFRRTRSSTWPSASSTTSRRPRNSSCGRRGSTAIGIRRRATRGRTTSGPICGRSPEWPSAKATPPPWPGPRSRRRCAAESRPPRSRMRGAGPD